jgi:type I restriction enzyme, S subunit
MPRARARTSSYTSHNYASLSDVCEFVSGGTPSKSNPDYWGGSFPWVSPKDMKTVEIDDATDHVTNQVFDETNLKKLPPQTVLIVVRGMILVHTVPLAITTSEVAINQDIKGIYFREKVEPLFGLWALKVQRKYLLSQIDTAAHGTKRFDLGNLRNVRILLPTNSEQEKFVDIVLKFSNVQKNQRAQSNQATELFGSLSQRAFLGEL